MQYRFTMRDMPLGGDMPTIMHRVIINRIIIYIESDCATAIKTRPHLAVKTVSRRLITLSEVQTSRPDCKMMQL